ncbi:Two component system histidine kinase [plant metagenome]|uniref:histidine kinase n=1 Tax=plant metagenome TaxID=1297885 RepID=A0A484SH30_9ZZZZ
MKPHLANWRLFRLIDVVVPRVGIRPLLVALLLPGIIGLLMLDSWNDYRTLSEITAEAYDSSLLEPARVLESSVEFANDLTLRISAPMYAQVLLESRAGLRKYYRVEEIDPPIAPGKGSPVLPGRALIGMPDMPMPPQWPADAGEPVFYDSVYRNDPVRVVAIWRDLFYRGAHRQVLVQVAESMGPRLNAEERGRQQEALRDARMVVLVVLLVWLGVALALRPLYRLRNEIRSRSPQDLKPLDPARVPNEVVPLVEAVNHHIARYGDMLAEQSAFLADASHQLRTPLAIMLTQAEYALRERDPQRMREGLHALIEQLGRTRRLTEQLLSLAHASHEDERTAQAVDVDELARAVVLRYLPLAREKNQDLGCLTSPAPDADEDRTRWPLVVQGIEAELQEALSNLVHNALHYAPPGACITVSVEPGETDVLLAVTDDGPGLEPALRERAFGRFDRAGAEKGEGGSGSGLGLAIARAYARRNGGDATLEDGEVRADGGVGLRAVLRLPRG